MTFPRPRRLPVSARGAGFTLLELVIVMGVLAVLLGVGIGFLQRGSTARGETMAALRAEFRRAALTARSRSLPTEVLLTADDPDAPATVRSRVLEPVAVWHLEPDERPLPLFRPVLSGTYEPGRFGHAMAPATDEVASMFSIAARGAAFDLGDGFAFRFDLRLQARGACSVLRLGRSLELELSAALQPKVRMVQRDDRGGRGVSVLFEADGVLPVRTWCTLELVHDGYTLSLWMNGRELGRRPAPRALYQADGDILEFSPGDAPVAGLIDEIQLLAYAWGEPLELPLQAELMAQQMRIVFDRRGEILGAASFAIQFQEDEAPETFTVGSGGVVE